MRKKMKRWISAMGSVLLVFGYFYILFCNLLCSFSLSAETRGEAIRAIIVAFAVAVLLPGALYVQDRYIRKLEQRIDELERKYQHKNVRR